MKYLIAGLGNVGREYDNTRHNIGFMVLDAFAKASGVVFTTHRYGDVAEVSFKGRNFVLLKPSTYMNLSGNAVNYRLQIEKIEKINLLVVVDDVALPFGVLRMRGKGSDGGHNGLRHISRILGGDDFARLRFGIGNDFPQGYQAEYVLSKWDKKELSELEPFIEKAVEAVKSFGTIGLERTMNLFNTKEK